MPVQTLYQSGAYGAGAEAWIIPTCHHSTWSAEIDWYLNFQLSRAKSHKVAERSPALNDILNENEIEWPHAAQGSETPLMVATIGRLPSEVVIELPDINNAEKWITQAHKVWTQLGHPPVRLFLPQFIKDKDVENLWPAPASEVQLTVVPDRTPNRTQA